MAQRLRTFCRNMHTLVAEFETHWLAEREKDNRAKQDWPLTQPSESDWLEQFNAWLDLREETPKP